MPASGLAETRRVSGQWLKRLRTSSHIDSAALIAGPGHQVSAFVVDASVVVKWLFLRFTVTPRVASHLEHGSSRGSSLAETANTLWKKVRRGS